MAKAATATTPAKENFAALLEESFGGSAGLEGSVLKGTVIAIENDTALIDVGLKSEGRVALKEFATPGQRPEIKIGDRWLFSRLAAHIFLWMPGILLSVLPSCLPTPGSRYCLLRNIF